MGFILFGNKKSKRVFGEHIRTVIQRDEEMLTKAQKAKKKSSSRSALSSSSILLNSRVSNVPEIVQIICSTLRSLPAQQGLFREVGSVTRIQKAVDCVNKGKALPTLELQPNDLAGLLKRYFRDLPEPLLTFSHYQTILDIAKLSNKQEQIDRWRQLFHLSLPDPNQSTLRYLVEFLRYIGGVEQYTMTLSNLAVCFAPNLVHNNNNPSDPEASAPSVSKLQNAVAINSAVLILLEHAQHILQSERTVISEHQQQDTAISQTVPNVQSPLIAAASPLLHVLESEPLTDQLAVDEKTIALPAHAANPEPGIPVYTDQSPLVDEEPQSRTEQVQLIASHGNQIFVAPLSPARNRPDDEDNSLSMRAARQVDENSEELYVSLRRDIKRLRRILSEERERSATEFKSMNSRIDNMETWLFKKGYVTKGTKKDLHEVKDELLKFREELIYREQDLRDQNQKISRIEASYRDLFRRIEDISKEEKYSRVKVEWENEHMKSSLAAQAEKLRQLSLDVATLKARLDGRVAASVARVDHQHHQYHQQQQQQQQYRNLSTPSSGSFAAPAHKSPRRTSLVTNSGTEIPAR